MTIVGVVYVGVLEEIVSKDVKKFGKRGPDMGLIDDCFRIAACDDERRYAHIGAPYYARQAVAEKAGMYRVNLEVVRIIIDHTAKGLPPEEEQLANAYEAAISNRNWLLTLRKKGSLLSMPGYSNNYFDMAAEYRHAMLVSEVNLLLGRRNGNSAKVMQK